MADFKITTPGAADQVPLARRLAALDAGLSGAAVLWVVGLPGAGKTSTAAQWVHAARAQGERCIWYRLDEDDADVAGVFNALRNHPRHGAPDRLPAWSPDNQADLRRFAQRFFTQLVQGPAQAAEAAQAAPPAGLTLVFDDCHRVPDDSPFFELLDAARDVPGGRLLLLSRRPPPPLLARGVVPGWLRLHDGMALSLQEATAVAEGVSGRPWTSSEIAQLQGANGWMAHVLALARAGGSALPSADAIGQVGDFLCQELLLMLPRHERRDFSLLAELPEVPRGLLRRQQVQPHAARLLDQLAVRRYFVEVTAADAWRLHDLLRDGLRAHNAFTESPAALADARRQRAAWVLPYASDTAMNLLVAAADHDGALAVLQQHGRAWLAQGRHAQLLHWLRDSNAPRNPQALLWQAEALLPTEPEAARPLFAQARAMLLAQRRGAAGADTGAAAVDPADAYRAWCGQVASYVVQWGAVQGLAELVDELEALEAAIGPAPAEWRFRTAADALTALMYGRAEDPRIRRYADATAQAVEQAPDAGSRIAAAGQLLIYKLWWAGDYPAGQALYDSFDDEVEHSTSLAPLARLIWWSNSAILDWQCGDPARCYSKVDRGLALAEASGVHVRDFFLLTQGIFCALAQEDWPRAEAYLAQLAQTERDHKRLDVMVHHFFRSWYALSRGDSALALVHAQTAWPLAEAMGSLFHKVIVLSALAPAALHTGNMALAQHTYRQQLGLAKLAGNPTFGYIAFCAGAEIALTTGDQEGLKKQLDRILLTKQMGRFHSDCGWRTPIRARLLAFALQHEVHPAIARQWILEKGVPPPAGFEGDWPRPVHLFALGHLRVAVNGVEDTSTKPSHRLRDMLAVLVACRPGAAQGDLRDWLWPESEGDKAAASLKAAVHRLRAWLGADALLVRNGMVALNPQRVSCDLWTQQDHAPLALTQAAHQVLGGCDAPPVQRLRDRLAAAR